VVRSNVQPTAPYNNWTQLSIGNQQRCVIKEVADSELVTLSFSTRLRAGIWICYALEIGGFITFLARVQTRVETIQITADGSFFAILSFASYVNRNTVSMGVRQ
jgi:hypothetical protein